MARGQLATHPTGLARLELRSDANFVERHLLQGDEYRASRDGQLLEKFHPFLPPVFLLQATSGAALAAALESFGVSEQEVVLGRMGDPDCYVFGGRLPGPPDAERRSRIAPRSRPHASPGAHQASPATIQEWGSARTGRPPSPIIRVPGSQ